MNYLDAKKLEVEIGNVLRNEVTKNKWDVTFGFANGYLYMEYEVLLKVIIPTSGHHGEYDFYYKTVNFRILPGSYDVYCLDNIDVLNEIMTDAGLLENVTIIDYNRIVKNEQYIGSVEAAEFAMKL